MYNRQDYINGKCSHNKYYHQLVEKSNARKIVLSSFEIPTLVEKYKQDKYFNNITLDKWDRLTNGLMCDFRKFGDYSTLAGAVCVLKQAAREIVTEYIENNG